MNYGPASPFSDRLHAEKYRAAGESFRDAMTRVASVLADNPEHFTTLRDILLNMRFLPGGRIQAAIGSLRTITPYNCFVSGVIDDSFVEGHGCIMARATEAARTMRLGGGIGYDFSTIRPRGEMIKKLGSKASGPVSFMDIFDAVCRVTASSGHRRGAQMGILRIDHPDIEEFIRAKQNNTRLTGFNISVALTDQFMKSVELDQDFNLVYRGNTYKTVKARALWDSLMRSTYDWSEPGVIFIDTINKMNNLYYCETISATNPCGEQPLPPYGACLLGSFNLVKYLTRNSNGVFFFNWQQFFLDIHIVVAAMDNVIDVASYPMKEQEDEALNKRRMGLGVTGVANTIEALGYPYGTPGFINTLSIILNGLRDTAYLASIELAERKGTFPLYDRDKYLAGNFINTLPDHILDALYNKGIRNSHLLSIAPTGTISLAADNVSSGIEPVFATSVERTVIEFNGPITYTITDYGVEYLDHTPKVASECTLREHLEVLKCAARSVDSAVSKTCNVPKDCSWEQFKNIYMEAWKAGCKGCTTYRIGGYREGILKATVPTPTEEPSEVCGFDPITGARTCE